MGPKVQKKKLASYEKRVKKSYPMIKIVTTAIRKHYMKGNTNTAVLPPRRLSTQQKYNFTKALRKLDLDNMAVSLRKIDDSICIGAFAKSDIEANRVLSNVHGFFVSTLTVATNHRSSVTDFDEHSGEVKRYQELVGTLALINHACDKHSNCRTVFGGNDSKHDYNVVESKRRIARDEEITITYDYNCLLQCRECN